MPELMWDIVDDVLMRPSALNVQRMPTFYPSSASCYNAQSTREHDVIGGCNRASFYRCSKHPESDASGIWSQYVFAGGNIWEKWILSKLSMGDKGILLGSNLKFNDLDRYISGEIDGIFLDTERQEKILIEVKTFFGYQGKKKICGNKTISPSPKDEHLLQALLYLDQFKDQASKIVLMYFARDDHSRMEFHVTLEDVDGKTCPKISYFRNNGWHQYTDVRISIEDVYRRYDELMVSMKLKVIPPTDYEHEYSPETIRELFDSGDIGKTAYAAWSRNSGRNPIGHWRCAKYCNYRTTCLAHTQAGTTSLD